jgi:hypothetical protein
MPYSSFLKHLKGRWGRGAKALAPHLNAIDAFAPTPLLKVLVQAPYIQGCWCNADIFKDGKIINT